LNSTRITTTSFGPLPDGTDTQLFTLVSPELTLTLTTFGARLVSLLTRDRKGDFADISLGYNDANAYATHRNAFFGATIGRYSNRIARGEFRLDGKSYQVPANNGVNALHGGPHGFDRRNWSAHPIANGVEFTWISDDGDQGFPGRVQVWTSYTIEGKTIRLRYRASTDKPTVVNLTNHTYFNLAGEGSPSILDHELILFADSITAIDQTLIPTGERMPITGTPFDFTASAPIGSRINDPHPQLLHAKGYDHNYVLRDGAGTMRPAARVHHAPSGRVFNIATTEPGVQFYSGNFLDGSLVGKRGAPYPHRSAFCLETQHFPDSPNHPEFPSTVLLPGETYSSETVWTFDQD
jgi:aldose 1-epimerase